MTQIAATEAASTARWDDMPVLTSVNAIREVKPGATVLLNGTDERRRDQVVLASQRYGRGKTLAFPVQDSWHWQMDVKMTRRGPDARKLLATAAALARRRRAEHR